MRLYPSKLLIQAVLLICGLAAGLKKSAAQSQVAVRVCHYSELSLSLANLPLPNILNSYELYFWVISCYNTAVS